VEAGRRGIAELAGPAAVAGTAGLEVVEGQDRGSFAGHPAAAGDGIVGLVLGCSFQDRGSYGHYRSYPVTLALVGALAVDVPALVLVEGDTAVLYPDQASCVHSDHSSAGHGSASAAVVVAGA
jgi:hypothetical protein